MLVVPRSSYRLRLGLGAAAAAGADVATLYTVVSVDGFGVSPSVAGVLVLAESPDFVELALTEALVDGGAYDVSAVGVPTALGSVTGTERFRMAVRPISAPIEGQIVDIDRALFGADLVLVRGDLAEGPDGDLAEVSGLANLEGAVSRRIAASGLPIDPTYGARPRQYVDAPTGAAASLAGALVAQATADPRVLAASTTFVIEGSDVFFDTAITPVADESAVIRTRTAV